jgi:hypothetical protein
MIPNGRTRTRLDVVVRAERKEPEITFELLLEIAKKLDTMRADGVRDAREKAERAAAERATKEAQGRFDLEARSNAARAKRLTDLEALTGLHLGGSSTWWRKDLADVTEEEGATLLRQWCQGEAVRRTIAQCSRDQLASLIRQAKALIEAMEEAP